VIALHPPFSSFPLALIVVAALLEISRCFVKRDWIESCISVCVALGAFFVACAFFSGYSASEHADATFAVPDEVIGLHHTFGRFLLFAMIPCVALRFISLTATHGKLGFSIAYRVILSLCVALVLYTGYLGGRLVFEYGAGVTAAIPRDRTPNQNH
jgi:uncharacterized membrane protein